MTATSNGNKKARSKALIVPIILVSLFMVVVGGFATGAVFTGKQDNQFTLTFQEYDLESLADIHPIVAVGTVTEKRGTNAINAMGWFVQYQSYSFAIDEYLRGSGPTDIPLSVPITTNGVHLTSGQRYVMFLEGEVEENGFWGGHWSVVSPQTVWEIQAGDSLRPLAPHLQSISKGDFEQVLTERVYQRPAWLDLR